MKIFFLHHGRKYTVDDKLKVLIIIFTYSMHKLAFLANRREYNFSYVIPMQNTSTTEPGKKKAIGSSLPPFLLLLLYILALLRHSQYHFSAQLLYFSWLLRVVYQRLVGCTAVKSFSQKVISNEKTILLSQRGNSEKPCKKLPMFTQFHEG